MSSKSKKRAASKASPAKSKMAPKMARPASQSGSTMTAQQLLGQFFPNTNLTANTSTMKNPMEGIMNNTKTSLDKMTQDATNMGRESMEAFIKSSTIFAKGFEDLMRTGMAMAKTSAEKQSQMMKQAMTSKSLNEFATAQNKLAQASFDDFMATTTKLSEMSVKMMNETAEPLSEQMTKAMQKTSKSMAS